MHHQKKSTSGSVSNNKNNNEDIQVNTGDVSFEVRIPKVKGSGRSGTNERVLRLPRDEGELPKALDNQQSGEENGKKKCWC